LIILVVLFSVRHSVCHLLVSSCETTEPVIKHLVKILVFSSRPENFFEMLVQQGCELCVIIDQCHTVSLKYCKIRT